MRDSLRMDLYAVKSSASLFVYQAEDGIRDLTVTGVQTCALPICRAKLFPLFGIVYFESVPRVPVLVHLADGDRFRLFLTPGGAEEKQEADCNENFHRRDRKSVV